MGEAEKNSLKGKESAGEMKFGVWKGVYLPSVLTILGAVLYLRLGWMVGHVGLFAALIIILVSSSLTFLTGLSITATATNMRVGGGSACYMISRSFGLEMGGAIGLSLYLAQALGISFYLGGFAESLTRLVPAWDERLIATAALIVLGLTWSWLFFAPSGFLRRFYAPTSKKWRGAELYLNTLVETEEKSQTAFKHLRDFIKEGRLAAGLQVHLKPRPLSAVEAVAEHSKEADLVLLGLRAPGAEEETVAYASYLKGIFRSARKLNAAAFCLAAEEISFEAIFE